MGIERRIISRPIEVRAAEGEPVRLRGYAAVFGEETTIAGFFREVIAPGAFTEAIGRDDVRALYNHDPNFVLGRTAAGTLRLAEDAAGLHYEIDPPDTTWARDLLVTVGRGDVSQSSFGFEVASGDDVWLEAPGMLPLRTIKRATLYDVSPVTYPAYPSTSVEARAEAKRVLENGPAALAGLAALAIRQKRAALIEALG